MTRHSVEIAGSTPADTRISIDGHDISTAVQHLVLDMDARQVLPVLRLELAYIELRAIEMPQTQVTLTAPTRDALVALGWTPPPEEE